MDMISSKSENRPQTGKRKAPKSAFKPGVCGNPGGRPKRTPEEFELIATCKLKAPAALEVWLKLMVDASSDAVKLSAATAVIERAYGKSTTVIDAKVSTHDDNILNLA